MKKRLLAALCLALMLCTLLPLTASADSAIEKVLCTTSTIPVAQADSRDIYAATSTEGCYVENYLWRRTSDGYIVYQLFGTENVQVEITLRALDGWYFSDSAAVYLNNSRADFYIGEGGKTLTLTRTYAPELWAPSVIKHPGSETLDEGGLASFVASATLTAEYKWYVLDPVSGEHYPGEEVPALFEGCSIGSNREGQFNIYNVPAAMDGWKVYCVFSGPGGEVRSAEAGIKVNYETPPPTESPEPSPEPEPEASPEPSPGAPPAEAETDSADDTHAHSFSELWRRDDTLHWKECACGARMNEGSHILRWSDVREASRREPGLSVGRCDSCGYELEKEIEYKRGNNILYYVLLGLGGIVALTILLLIIDAIRQNRRRRRRRRRRRK